MQPASWLGCRVAGWFHCLRRRALYPGQSRSGQRSTFAAAAAATCGLWCLQFSVCFDRRTTRRSTATSGLNRCAFSSTTPGVRIRLLTQQTGLTHTHGSTHTKRTKHADTTHRRSIARIHSTTSQLPTSRPVWEHVSASPPPKHIPISVNVAGVRYIHRRCIYKGDTSTHAHGTDSRVALLLYALIFVHSWVEQLDDMPNHEQKVPCAPKQLSFSSLSYYVLNT